MTEHFDHYRQLLEQQDMRVTPQRIFILQAIDEGQGHVTADEITIRIRTHFPAISAATIYRTLDQLCKAGLISSSRIKERQMVYELVGEQPHNHLVCEYCGRVINIDDKEMSSMYSVLTQLYGFVARAQHIVINGSCADCISRMSAAQ